ncbi:hypothetical protein HGP28_16125 [Vibrio sp. SM6]|uniref:Uncharacterized protein n=1 Tax=Vibrio agarilyticus TaxID=2726741 RepID=A0A7X8YHS8_9VIBR|nr:hypothetical protein [Vibrio agarilyticus]NLS14408.1 hypothetical protein [Vibrio agarilyticus]
MYSQTLFAQLCRMTALLVLSLIVLHQSPQLISLFAHYAMDSGCHQQHAEHAQPHHH